jgi:2-haloacid dehalogenase
MIPAAVVFDLYGTLLEIDSLRTAAARVSETPDAFVAAWRQKQLAYAFAAAIMGRYEDFDRLTRYALYHVAAGAGAHLAREDLDALIDAWQTVRPYDDAIAALTAVRAAGVPTAVLTNGTRKSARAALTNAGAHELIDVLLSVEDVETYKPDPAVYRMATRRFEAAPERLVFVTSNGWDATGAREFGMSVVWCNRAGAAVETFGRPPSATIASLSELGAAIESLSD